MKSYASTNGDIFINFSDENDVDVGTLEQKNACEQALSFLLSYPKRKSLCEKAVQAITTVIESGTCLHPDFFLTEPGLNINSRIPERFLVASTLGFSLIEHLTPFGLFSTADRRKGTWGSALRNYQYRALAAVSMMIVGVDDLTQLSEEAITDVILHFRTPDTLRWREGLLNSEQMAITAFRDLTRALAKFYESDEIATFARQTKLAWKGTVTWAAFSKNPTPLQRELLQAWESYSEHSQLNPTVGRQVVMDFDKLISSHGHTSIKEAFNGSFQKNAYVTYLKERNGVLPTTALTSVSAAKRLSDHIVSELTSAGDDQARPIVTESDVRLIRREIGDQVRPQLSESNARPMPEQFAALARQILSEGPDGWPGRNFQRLITYQGKTEKIYCPVLPTLMHAMLLIPLRAVQFRRMDSGEGDTRVFNGHTFNWEKNQSSTAGYWVQKGICKDHETLGYAYEFKESNPPIVGFNVNTNKTGSPYKIPWALPELHKILWELAEWQRKYNPVKQPTNPKYYVDSQNKTPKKTLQALPDIFPLFRIPSTSRQPESGRVVPTGMLQKAFLELLLEIETRWNSTNVDRPVKIITSFNKNSGQPERAIYTLHGLRVRGITNLYMAGVPIEVISKIIAGHATVAMTLYYLKFEPAALHSMLESSLVVNTSAEMNSFVNEFANMKVSDARRRTTYLEDCTVDQVESLDKNLFCSVDIGICPYSGERCHDGGPLARTEKGQRGGPDKSTYLSVPGGSRNCIMCRHFVSGTPFILPLELFGSKLLWKRNQHGRDLEEHKQRLSVLRSKQKVGEISREQFRVQMDRLRAENQTLKNSLEKLDEAILRVNLHLTAASKILKEDLDSGLKPSVALVATDAHSVTEYVERSAFEMTSLLTSASRFWSILKDDKLEHAQQRFLDQIMFNSNETPLSFRLDLTDGQRAEAGSLLTQFLMQRLSSTDREKLVEGTTNLKSLNLGTQVQDLMTAISFKEITVAKPISTVACLEAS